MEAGPFGITSAIVGTLIGIFGVPKAMREAFPSKTRRVEDVKASVSLIEALVEYTAKSQLANFERRVLLLVCARAKLDLLAGAVRQETTWRYLLKGFLLTFGSVMLVFAGLAAVIDPGFLSLAQVLAVVGGLLFLSGTAIRSAKERAKGLVQKVQDEINGAVLSGTPGVARSGRNEPQGILEEVLGAIESDVASRRGQKGL